MGTSPRKLKEEASNSQKGFGHEVLLEKSWQELTCLKIQIEARIKQETASMAQGSYSAAELEDVVEEIVLLLAIDAFDIVT